MNYKQVIHKTDHPGGGEIFLGAILCDWGAGSSHLLSEASSRTATGVISIYSLQNPLTIVRGW